MGPLQTDPVERPGEEDRGQGHQLDEVALVEVVAVGAAGPRRGEDEQHGEEDEGEGPRLPAPARGEPGGAEPHEDREREGEREPRRRLEPRLLHRVADHQDAGQGIPTHGRAGRERRVDHARPEHLRGVRREAPSAVGRDDRGDVARPLAHGVPGPQAGPVHRCRRGQRDGGAEREGPGHAPPPRRPRQDPEAERRPDDEVLVTDAAGGPGHEARPERRPGRRAAPHPAGGVGGPGRQRRAQHVGPHALRVLDGVPAEGEGAEREPARRPSRRVVLRVAEHEGADDQVAQGVEQHQAAPAEVRERERDRRVEGRRGGGHRRRQHRTVQHHRVEVGELLARRQPLGPGDGQAALAEAEDRDDVIRLVDRERAGEHRDGQDEAEGEEQDQDSCRHRRSRLARGEVARHHVKNATRSSPRR